MKRKPTIYCYLLALFALPTVVRAAPLTWDTTIADDNVITAGGGTWTDGAGPWNDGTTSTAINWSSAPADDATFAGEDGTHAITIAGPLAVGSMTFSNSGYTLSSAAPQVIASSGPISIATGKSATIGSGVTVTRATTQSIIGGGTLNVTGTGAAITSSAGNTNIAGGTKLVIGTGGMVTNTFSFVVGSDTNTGNELEVNGGTFSINAGTPGPINLVLANGTTGSAAITLNSGNITNTRVTSGEGMRFGVTSTNTASSTFNLNGGTLTVGQVYEGNAGHISTFNFNGGILRVQSGSLSGAAFMTGLNRANVRNGGAIINTQSVTTTIGQALVTSNISGDNAIDGGLTKQGTGALTLSGINTYTGATTISAGRLQFSRPTALYNNTTASWTASNIRVASGATFAINIDGTNEFTAANVNTLFANLSGANGSATTGLAAGSTIALDTSNGGSILVSGVLADSTGTGGGAVGLTKLGGATLVLEGTNTYTGTTTISGGTLQIGNGSSGGNIATSSAVVNNGTLLYRTSSARTYANVISGIGAFRQTSASTVTLTNTNTYTGATTISGGGTLQLGNNTTTGSLTGTSAINTTGTFNSVITNGTLRINRSNDFTQFTDLSNVIISGNGSFTQAGSGITTLSLVNTYTGITTISGGTLRLGANNVLPNATTSTVSIGTATLDADTRTDTLGTLDVTGNAVINLGTGAALAFADSKAVDWTGGTLNITGTLGATSLRFGDSADDLTSGPSGQLAKISVNGSGLGTYVLDASGYLVPGAGTDTTPPTLLGITDTAGASPVTVNTLVTYTVTFSEDMNASTVTAADFNNAGTASVTIGSVTETTPGVFTVQVTPTSAGSLTLRIGGPVLQDTAANTLVVPLSDDTTITVRTQYQAWAGGGAFDADANGDGVLNGLAFLLGAANPNSNAQGVLPRITESINGLTLEFQMLPATARGSASLALEYSNTLGSWTSVAIPSGSTTVDDIVFVITGTNPLTVNATIPTSKAIAGKLFGRMKGLNP